MYWIAPASAGTATITLKVLAIPGRPDFKGPVGQFGVSATADRKNVPAGEAVTLKVRLSGAGNLRTATETPVLTIPNVKVYPPSSRTLPARGAGKGGTSAEWDFVLVPSVPGKLVVPPVAFEVGGERRPWRIAGGGGALSLVFLPQGAHREARNLLVLRTRFAQVAGNAFTHPDCLANTHWPYPNPHTHAPIYTDEYMDGNTHSSNPDCTHQYAHSDTQPSDQHPDSHTHYPYQNTNDDPNGDTHLYRTATSFTHFYRTAVVGSIVHAFPPIE